jgi:hypothetical protein
VVAGAKNLRLAPPFDRVLTGPAGGSSTHSLAGGVRAGASASASASAAASGAVGMASWEMSPERAAGAGVPPHMCGRVRPPVPLPPGRVLPQVSFRRYPVSRYRRLRIQRGQGRGSLGYRFTVQP